MWYSATSNVIQELDSTELHMCYLYIQGDIINIGTIIDDVMT